MFQQTEPGQRLLIGRPRRIAPHGWSYSHSAASQMAVSHTDGGIALLDDGELLLERDELLEEDEAPLPEVEAPPLEEELALDELLMAEDDVMLENEVLDDETDETELLMPEVMPPPLPPEACPDELLPLCEVHAPDKHACPDPQLASEVQFCWASRGVHAQARTTNPSAAVRHRPLANTASVASLLTTAYPLGAQPYARVAFNSVQAAATLSSDAAVLYWCECAGGNRRDARQCCRMGAHMHSALPALATRFDADT